MLQSHQRAMPTSRCIAACIQQRSCTGTHLSSYEFDIAYKNNTLGFPELFLPSSLLLLQKSRREHKLLSDGDGREKNKVIFLALISVTPHYHVSRRRRKPRARTCSEKPNKQHEASGELFLFGLVPNKYQKASAQSSL